MTKIFCDICGREAEYPLEREMTIEKGGIITNKKIDVCIRCNIELQKRTAKIEREYMEENGVNVDAMVDKFFEYMSAIAEDC